MVDVQTLQSYYQGQWTSVESPRLGWMLKSPAADAGESEIRKARESGLFHSLVSTEKPFPVTVTFSLASFSCTALITKLDREDLVTSQRCSRDSRRLTGQRNVVILVSLSTASDFASSVTRSVSKPEHCSLQCLS